MERGCALVAAGVVLGGWLTAALMGRELGTTLTILLAGGFAVAVVRLSWKLLVYSRGPIPVPEDGPEADYHEPPG